jgi:hypothetical protein
VTTPEKSSALPHGLAIAQCWNSISLVVCLVPHRRIPVHSADVLFFGLKLCCFLRYTTGGIWCIVVPLHLPAPKPQCSIRCIPRELWCALSLSLLLRPPTTLLITLVYALRCTPEVCHVLLLGLLSLESSSAHPIALVHLSGATMSEFLHIHLFGLFFLDFLSFCGLHFINVIESSSLTLPIQKSQYFYTHVTQVWVACGLTWRMLYMTVDGNDLEVSEYTRYKWKGDTCIISKWWTTTLRAFL